MYYHWNLLSPNEKEIVSKIASQIPYNCENVAEIFMENDCNEKRQYNILKIKDIHLFCDFERRKDMAKFTVEVDLDWLDEETTIDEEIKYEVINGAREYLLNKTTEEIQNRLDEEIGKKLVEASEKVEEVVNGFIECVTTDNISKLKIAEKTSSWSDKVTMTPISEYIGKQFEKFCNEKRYDKNFSQTSYERERVYSVAQVSILRYLKETLGEQVENIVKTAQRNAEKEIVESLEHSLKQNLAEETIKKMNIPQVLKNLEKSYERIGESEE